MRMTWEYLAGLFDGEGNLCPTQGTIVWSISQSNQRGDLIMQEIQQFLNEQGCWTHRVRAAYRTSRGTGVMHICRTRNRTTVRQICKHLRPYSRIKRHEIQDAWRYLSLYAH